MQTTAGPAKPNRIEHAVISSRGASQSQGSGHTIGDTKALRKELDLTREQLAQRIGCAEITLQKIEQDSRRPSKQIAELLAQALGVSEESRDAFIQFARGDGQTPIPKTAQATHVRQARKWQHE